MDKETKDLLSRVMSVLKVNLTYWAYKDEASMYAIYEEIGALGIKSNEEWDEILEEKKKPYLPPVPELPVVSPEEMKEMTKG